MILRYLFFLFPLALFCQQDGYLSLYSFNMNLINPAYAGSEGSHVFSLTSRNQWNTIEDSPQTTGFSYSMARSNNVGLGISIISDKIFIENQTMITLDFSYKLTLGNDSAVFLGIKGGGNSYSADPTPLLGFTTIPDPAQKSLSRFNPNMGVGFLFKMGSVWVSGSMPRLFNSKRDEDIQIQSRDRIHIYFAGGTQFNINEDFAIKPNLIYRKGKGLPNSIDFGSWVSYLNKFDIGISFKSGSVFSFLTSVGLGENISIGYAYDTYRDAALSGLNLNGHELAIRFNLGEAPEKIETEEETQEE
jgi:type IX secretion system PorP/SprF family membrane protein